MKIGVLGTGMVGETIATKLVALGHQVTMGARSRDNEKAAAWVKQTGGGAAQGTFADAATAGELLWNCTAGVASLDALAAAGADALRGKLLIDVANPLDFSKGMPPSLSVGNTDSLAEQIQRAHPECTVVKAFNTVNCHVMVDPGRVKGEHDLLICGNDAEAKGRVREIATGWFGWKSVLDLGDLTAARGIEGYVPLWVRMYGFFGSPDFGVKFVR
jgi:8-hydroxy-5-deazaflavin:NADPH oxidoreductase